jgi:G3E family GTPase
MAEHTRIPVTVVTGFLGSGKTTRLNALLRDPRGRRIAVILNELGEVGIDASRLVGAQEFVELDGGCVCCTLNADLEATLRRLRARGGFEHVVLETTGIADPLPVAWTFERPGVREGYRVDAVVAVADALNLGRLVASEPEGTLQIERADVILASKLDLVPDGLSEVARLVRPLNPVAPLLAAPPDATPWDLLLDTVSSGQSRASTGPAQHAHGHHWETWRLETKRLLSEASLEEFLRVLPPGLYRVKGLVRTAATPSGWLRVNAVGGRYELEPCAPQPEPALSVLFGVGHGFDRQALDDAAATLCG